MPKIGDARTFLNDVGMPLRQQTDLCCYVLLAMSGVKPNDKWSVATNQWIRIHDIIQFININYGTTYAENSRETFRKQALHHFRTAALIEDNGKVTNSPNYRYRLTDETLTVIKEISGKREKQEINRFLIYHKSLIEIYASKKEMTKMPDVVLYREEKNWIYFIESVTSVGPMDPKRIIEITEMTKNVTAGKIFVTAFQDFKTFKSFSESLAWETEVWISAMPDHMIHLNGDKFFGPR